MVFLLVMSVLLAISRTGANRDPSSSPSGPREGPSRRGGKIGAGGKTVQTLDEMLGRKLLTPAQHAAIAAWIAQAKTPEAIRRMPAPLWRTLELASVLMDVDADLTQPPPMSLEA
jgi:hypothetical protein